MAYFDYGSKVPPAYKDGTWLLCEGETQSRAINIPKLLTDLGWIYQFKTLLPRDDNFEAEQLLDHGSLHVFDEWTCIMGPVDFGLSSPRPLFDMYFRTELDLLMAKMILL